MKFSVTLSVDQKKIETKPFYAKNKEEAIKKAEEGRKDFPNAEEIDAVNVEVVE